MKYHNERKAALLTAILAMTVLFYTLILPASASALTAAREDHNHPRLHKSIAFEIEDGKVTDSDGIIGNSLHGADAHHNRHHRHASTPMQGMRNAAGRMINGAENAADNVANGVKNAADDLMDGTKNAADKVINGAKNAADNVMDGAKNAADRMTDGAKDATQRASDNTTGNQSSTTASDNSGSIIGWIVTALIVLAIVLVVLALLPKKMRNRR